jgi:hypothetical protein
VSLSTTKIDVELLAEHVVAALDELSSGSGMTTGQVWECVRLCHPEIYARLVAGDAHNLRGGCIRFDEGDLDVDDLAVAAVCEVVS